MAGRRPPDARVAPPRRPRTLLALLAVAALVAACRSAGAGPDTAPTSWTLAPGWKDAPCSDEGAGVVTGTVRSVTGAPIFEARVSTKTRPCWTETDSMGRFRLEGLPPGLTWLRAARQGFHADSTLVRHDGTELTVAFVLAGIPDPEAEVPPGFDLSAFDLTCSRSSGRRLVWGTVADTAGAPIGGAQVMVLEMGADCGALTDSLGRFAIMRTHGDQLTLEVMMIGYHRTEVPVPAHHDPARVDVVLEHPPWGLGEIIRTGIPRDTVGLGNRP